jgi:3-oxoacyl-[acyl-carrier protein] reductase
MQLQDKVIAITGGGGGLGRAMARRLGRAGARLALIDRDRRLLGEAADSLAEQGLGCSTYAADIGSEEEVEALFTRLDEEFGRLDGLINNAGIIRDGPLVKVEDGRILHKMSLAFWQEVIDVNLTGVFLCGREAAAMMATGGAGGCIVNISSISAQGNRGQSNYSAAKAGVIALTVTWAKELAPYGIRSAAIAPGFIGTPILDNMKQEALAKMTSLVPAGRVADADEIAEAAEFILGNDYFNGRVLEIDGGLRI